MDVGREEAPAPAPFGRRLIGRWVKRVAELAKQHSTSLLSVLVILLVNGVFITAIVQYRLERLRLILFYVFFMLMYAALYLWRRLRAHRQHARFRSGLGYAAFGLGTCMSALFFYTFAPAASKLPLAIGAWLLLVVPACWCLYRIVVLHIEDAEAAGLRVQVELEMTQMPAANQ